MGHSLEQAKHNESFHLYLCAVTSDRFIDWKITCLFYAALHLVKELASVKRVSLGDKHELMLDNINPRSYNRKISVKLDFYQSYSILFRHSRSARYDGFINYEEFIKSKIPVYLECQNIYAYLKKEVIRLGVRI